jgi:hypothetical protein
MHSQGVEDDIRECDNKEWWVQLTVHRLEKNGIIVKWDTETSGSTATVQVCKGAGIRVRGNRT